MDPLSLVLVVAVAGAGVAAVVLYRKRQVALARVGLRQAEIHLLEIDTALQTFVWRNCFLLERHVPPIAILAVTFTNRATEEMQHRLKQMGVSIADREKGGVTVSTLHSLGKRVVQAVTTGPISVADDRWTDSLVAGVLREGRTGQDPHLAQLYLKAIPNFHRSEDDTAPAIGGDKTYRTL